MPNIAHSQLGFLTWGYPTVLVLGVIALGHGQEQGQVDTEPEPAGRSKGAHGWGRAHAERDRFAYCSSCHEHPENYPDQSLVCRMVEYPVWKTKDRHQIAFDVLFSPRAQEMGTATGNQCD